MKERRDKMENFPEVTTVAKARSEYINQLAQIKKLFDDGIIDQDTQDKQKQPILDMLDV